MAATQVSQHSRRHKSKKQKKLRTGLVAETPSLDPKGVLVPARVNAKLARNLVTDFTVVNEGSIFLLIPNTEAANAWIESYLPEERMTFGRGVVVEHRYIFPIVQGIVADGLGVK